MITTGTIGGPETFAGQATVRLRAMYDFLEEPRYFSSGSILYEALADGSVDAIIGAAEGLAGTTSLLTLMHESLTPLYVVAEAQLPFRCALLGRKGASLSDVQTVFGGPVSLEQARHFLTNQTPQAQTETYHDPMATGRRIAAGQGNEAVLGTLMLADLFDLEVLAEDVDGGIVNANIWALSSQSRFDSMPTRLVITGRFRGDGDLGMLVEALADAGFRLATLSSQVTRRALFESDCLLRFTGEGSLTDVEQAVARGSGRLAGAIRPTILPC